MGHIASALQKKGFEVKATVRPPKASINIEKVKKDITEKLNQTIQETPTIPANCDCELKKNTVRYSKDVVFWHDRSGKISEQYRTLKTHLLAYYKDQPFSLIITSATQGEGKSVTCVNLGFALADACDRKVLIVDCDFRKRGVGHLLAQRGYAGIAEVLEGSKKIQDVILPTACRNLWVLYAGNLDTGKIAGFVGSSKLDSVVKELRKQFDCILFDTPAVTMLSDASVVGRIAGDSLLVVKMYHTRRPSVDEAIRRLSAVKVKTVGIVLTGLLKKQGDYLYRSAG